MHPLLAQLLVYCFSTHSRESCPYRSWGKRMLRSISRLGLPVLLVMAASFGEAVAGKITVNLNEDVLLRLPKGIATIVVGNPLIADVSLQNGGFLVITGKGYGMTNLVILNGLGQILSNYSLIVEGPRRTTTVHNGMT